MDRVRAWTLAVAIGAVGCPSDDVGRDDRGRLGDACGAEIRACGDDLVCLAGRCRQACVANTDCTSLEACDEGVCMGLDEYCANLDNVGVTAVDTADGARSCVIESCAAGWEDLDGEWSNGCEEICAPTGPERCNGADDDCSGRADDVADLAADCASRFPTAVGVDAWACTGVCEIARCLDGYRNANGAKADGCELQCTITGSEVCDGLDNDCSGVVDDIEPNALASACNTEHSLAVHVADWTCAAGQCALGQCDGGWVDVDDQVATGCEAACVLTSPTTEVCDGQDNDCDGARDPEGSPGSTPYYRDDDGDTLGGGTARCLCAPSAPYVVTVGGDCDDSLASCTTDCSTDADHDGAIDCADSCVDWDGDGYGAPGGLGDSCFGSDCEDTPTLCGVLCHPGLEDVCDGWDNDCAGGPDSSLGPPPLCPLQLGVCAGAASPGCGGSSGWQVCEVWTYSGWAQSEFGVPYEDTGGGDEHLCDFFDSDCDGVTDDGCTIVVEQIDLPNDGTALAVDVDGNLWVGADNDAYYLPFGGDTLEFVGGLDNRTITAIALEADGDAWIGQDQGFCPNFDFDPPCECGVWHVAADRQGSPELYCTEGLSGNYASATALVVDDLSGRVFIGTDSDFTIYFPPPFDRADCDINLPVSNDQVWSVEVDDRSPQSLYLGTPNSIVVCEVTTLTHGSCEQQCTPALPFGDVSDIVFWDRNNADPGDDVIWVGQWDDGVSLVGVVGFAVLNNWREPLLPHRRVRALAFDDIGEQLFAGTNDGLAVYDVASDQWHSFDQELSNKNITALAFDATHGILWVTTNDRELYRTVIHWP